MDLLYPLSCLRKEERALKPRHRVRSTVVSQDAVTNPKAKSSLISEAVGTFRYHVPKGKAVFDLFLYSAEEGLH